MEGTDRQGAGPLTIKGNAVIIAFKNVLQLIAGFEFQVFEIHQVPQWAFLIAQQVNEFFAFVGDVGGGALLHQAVAKHFQEQVAALLQGNFPVKRN